MSREFNRIDTGTLGDNRFKDGPKHPDVTGKLEAMSADVIAAIAAGKPVRLAGWWKDGRDGQFLSLKVSVMRERTYTPSETGAQSSYNWGEAEARAKAEGGGAAESRQAALAVDFDDDIPF
jgi:hypothetical protein